MWEFESWIIPQYTLQPRALESVVVMNN